jgi:virginiamycin B lyase
VVTVLGANTSDPQGITLGPDGALWFTNSDNSIGRIAPDGIVTIFKTRNFHSPQGIVTGPDSALWFTNLANDSIGRITTAGKVSTFSLGSIVGFAVPDPNDITVGPDGALWFTLAAQNRIGRVTTSGVVTVFPRTAGLSLPLGITAGPDGALWFAISGTRQQHDRPCHHHRCRLQLCRPDHLDPVGHYGRPGRSVVVHQLR